MDITVVLALEMFRMILGASTEANLMLYTDLGVIWISDSN